MQTMPPGRDDGEYEAMVELLLEVYATLSYDGVMS